MADVFISYSRRDAAFVVRLAAALEARGKTVWVDLKDIPAGAPWREDIAEAIEAADGVVFVVSPDSLGSAHCREEARVARDQGKRIVPVVARPSDPDAAPVEVAELNWRISFTGDAGFDEQVGELVRALELDLDWVREHTRYQEEANQWERERWGSELPAARQRARGRGVSGWRARAGSSRRRRSARPSFVLASRQAYDAAAARVSSASLAAGLALAIGLSVFAFVQRQSAIDSRADSDAPASLRRAAVSQHRRTTQRSRSRWRQRPSGRTRTRRCVDVLREALVASGERAVRRVDVKWSTLSVEFDPTGQLAGDGRRATASRLWRVRRWAAASPARPRRVSPTSATFNRGTAGRSSTENGGASRGSGRWAVVEPCEGRRAYPYATAFSADGTIAVVGGRRPKVRVWVSATTERTARPPRAASAASTASSARTAG